MFFKHQINLEERLNETRTKRLSSINYLNRIFSLFEQTIKNLHTHFIMQLPTHPRKVDKEAASSLGSISCIFCLRIYMHWFSISGLGWLGAGTVREPLHCIRMT